MKKIFVALMAGLIISAAMPTMAQHHRHTPQASVKIETKADKDGNTKNTTAIVAFSDTTDTDTNDVDSAFNDADCWDDESTDYFDSISSITKNAIMPIAIVFIMFCLAPVLIIGLIIYFIIKSRNQKIKLAELALKNGQPIPQNIAKNANQPSDQELWRKGVTKMFIGLGIVMFSIFVHSGMCKGIGFIVLCYGAGQAIIAWTTKKGIAPAPSNKVHSNSTKGEDVDKEEMSSVNLQGNEGVQEGNGISTPQDETPKENGDKETGH